MIVRRLLVIDPDAEIGQLYENRFRAAGYIVIYSNNPKMALELARALTPDMILLDPGFPGGLGRQLIDDLIVAPETAHIPLMVTSEGALHDEIKKLAKDKLVGSVADKNLESLLKQIDTYFNSLMAVLTESHQRREKALRAQALLAGEKAEPQAPEKLIQKYVEPSHEEAAPRYKVVLVFDDPFFLRVYEAKLTQAGFFAYAVPDPDFPFEFISKEQPHVIVMSDKFAPEIIEHFKTKDARPVILNIMPEGKTCPKELSDWKGACLTQENLNPVKLISEIDQRMLTTVGKR